MHVAVMGSGGLGGFLGGRLADKGARVSFIARGAHLEAIRANGLRVISELGDVHVQPAEATDDPGSIGPVDVVLFTVKCYDTEAAAEACRPLLGPDTAVVTMQNGVDSVDMLARVLGRQHVLGCAAYLPTKIDEPGVIVHTGTMARAIIGELDGSTGPRLRAITDALKGVGVDVAISDRIETELWNKFVAFVAASGVCCVLRCTVGTLRSHAETLALFESALDEVIAVGRAENVDLPPDLRDKMITMLMKNVPAGARPSTLNDLLAGRRLETPWLNGSIVRLGRKHGVPTPTHDFIVAALTPHFDGAPDEE